MHPFAISWAEFFLGIDSGTIPEGADLRLTWTNAPRSWEVFVFLGVVAALVWFVVSLYRREVGTCGPAARRVLAGIRITVLLLLAIVFLAPAITFTDRRVLHPLVVLLRDDSQSMGTKDHYLDDPTAGIVARATGRSVPSIRQARPSRAELVHTLFEKNQRRFLGDLERRGRLRVVDFSRRTREVETRPARKPEKTGAEDPNGEAPGKPGTTAGEGSTRGLPPLEAKGMATDLHRAISEGLADRSTAAVVLFTDGQQTGREADRGSLLAIAEKARRQNVPLLMVGVGDPDRPCNLQVTDVAADPRVWKDDPFEIRALVRCQGAGGQSVQATLTEQKIPEDGEAPPAKRVIEQRAISLPTEDGPVRVAFTHTPKTAGRFAYSVHVEPVEGEVSDADNVPEAPAEVKVLSERARVLLVAGTPTWDYRQVARLLDRNKTVDLSGWLQTLDEGRPQDGNTPIRKLPVTREALFEYDVILLFDPDPIEFDKAWLELLEQFVAEHAGGVLYMAGPMFSNRFLTDPRTQSLGDLLPVRMGDLGAMEVASLLSTNTREQPLEVVEANADHPLMRLDPDAEVTRSAWKELPGIFWSFPANEVKPAARILIEQTDPALKHVEGARPLLATGRYGTGRTLYIGFSNTWRWRKISSNAERFNRFWLQAVRYLVEGRALEGKHRGSLETDRSRYEVGQRVMVTARLQDAAFAPLAQPEVAATLEAGNSGRVPVTLRQVANQPGRFEATVIAGRTGRHRLVVDFPDEASAPSIETTFSVAVPSLESYRTWLAKPLLVELAEASGGAYFQIDQLERLPEAIPDRRRTLDVQSKPLPIWDTGRVLLLLAALLALEWALRKRFKLL